MAEPLINRLFLAFNFEICTKYGRFRASKVKNIEQAVEVEEVREGGANEVVYSLVKPVQNGKKLVFERGLCEEYTNLRMDRLLGVRQEEPLTICIYDRTGAKIVRNYCVEGWMVTKWETSDLDSGMTGGILLEMVEMRYERLSIGDQ